MDFRKTYKPERIKKKLKKDIEEIDYPGIDLKREKIDCNKKNEDCFFVVFN